MIDGGKLYRDAWESKPPLFLYLYVGIIKVFGPGVFGLRVASTASAIATQFALFFVARRFMSDARALIATALCGVLLGVPFWEGELALTEIFTILPTALAVLALLIWDERAGRSLRHVDAVLVLAGALFGVAFLLRQTSLAAAAATGIWLLLRGRPWLRASTLCGFGFVVVVVPVVAAFEFTGDFHWFWDANVAFFFKYVPSGEQLSFATRPVIMLPFLVTAGALLLAHRRGAETPKWSLPGLWLTLTLAGALLTGRAYSHYFLQTFLPLSMLVAMALPAPRFDWRPSLRFVPALMFVAALAIEWVYVVMPMFNGDLFAMHWTLGADYYQNFGAWAAGKRSTAEYDDFFDKRVTKAAVVRRALRQLDAEGQKV
ncbi:MAG TPA: glycosyltransferase family 39 protein, partial [Dehalococcoidia bacterium]